ncbi:hypothetical protein ABPG77_004329 [Micractinium sp. CCAP 211/92]
MASFSEAELQQACSLLAAEFPDTPRNVLEGVLRECDLELPVARRKLLELQPQAPSQQTGASYSGSAAAAQEGDDNWFDWNKSMRDLGLESLGAQLSLLGRQVASSLNSILPPDLNPFGYDEEDLEDESAAAAARAAAEAERDKRSTAVAASARQLNARRGGVGSPGSTRFPTEEEGEEEDYDKLN